MQTHASAQQTYPAQQSQFRIARPAAQTAPTNQFSNPGSSDLQWRRSRRVAPLTPAPQHSGQDVFADRVQTQQARVQQTNTAQASQPRLAAEPVQQAHAQVERAQYGSSQFQRDAQYGSAQNRIGQNQIGQDRYGQNQPVQNQPVQNQPVQNQPVQNQPVQYAAQARPYTAPQPQAAPQSQIGSSGQVIQVSGTLQATQDAPQFKAVVPAAWNQSQQSGADFFDNPFGDDPPAHRGGAAPARAQQDSGLFSPPSEAQRGADPVLPNDGRPRNDLRERSLFDRINAPEPKPEAPQPPTETTPSTGPSSGPMSFPSGDLTPPSNNQSDESTDGGPSLGDRIRDSRPNEGTESPSDREDDMLPAPENNSQLDRSNSDEFENPFDSRGKNRDRDVLGDDDRDDDDDRDFGDEDESLKPKVLSCDDFRHQISQLTIDQVSLDISAPYRPDEIDLDRYNRLKARFDEKQEVRQWRSIDGSPIATGRLRDLAYEKAVIQTNTGATQELQMNKLSEADRAYISENWGLPSACLIEQVAYTPRNWTRTTMTWKASNLCHSPLYFEDVNLERYGHTHGPILEPIVQSAHFFANIAVLPYKMGVHSPRECQYALGYYRPGNCAPWIVPPVPLSARGAWSQAATMTGLFWLVP